MTRGLKPAPLSVGADEVADATVRAISRGTEVVWVPPRVPLRDDGLAPPAAGRVPPAPDVVVPHTVAAFDFDGTLTRRDSLLPFLASFVGRAELARAVASEAWPLARMAAGRADRDIVKEQFLGAGLWRVGLTPTCWRRGARTARSSNAPASPTRCGHASPGTGAKGHDIVIVSASLDVYLDPVARALGAAQLLSTSLEVDADGRCTGRLVEGNCRGPEKAKRLQAYLGDRETVLWAYGDSSGDTEMLALADHALARPPRPPPPLGSHPTVW